MENEDTETDHGFENLMAELQAKSAEVTKPDDPPAIVDDPNVDDPNADDPNKDDPNKGDPGADDPNAGDDPNKDDPNKDKTSKQEFAFAQMRTENTQLKAQLKQFDSTIGKLADALGITEADPEKRMAALVDGALGLISKRDNIPKEYLQRMDSLEANAQQHAEQRRAQTAIEQFGQVQADFELSEDQLMAFAQELDTIEGANPFLNDGVDLVKIYRDLHYDEIMQRKIDAAVEAALKADQAANDTSSTPTKGGRKAADANDKKITTVSGLNDYLDSLTAKK